MLPVALVPRGGDNYIKRMTDDINKYFQVPGKVANM